MKELTAKEREELDKIISRILAVSFEGLTEEEKADRKYLLDKKYPSQNFGTN